MNVWFLGRRNNTTSAWACERRLWLWELVIQGQKLHFIIWLYRCLHAFLVICMCVVVFVIRYIIGDALCDSTTRKQFEILIWQIEKFIQFGQKNLWNEDKIPNWNLKSEIWMNCTSIKIVFFSWCWREINFACASFE